MAATVVKVLKLGCKTSDGTSHILTVDNCNDTVDSSTLGDVTEQFNDIGYALEYAQYVTTTTEDKILNNV